MPYARNRTSRRPLRRSGRRVLQAGRVFRSAARLASNFRRSRVGQVATGVAASRAAHGLINAGVRKFRRYGRGKQLGVSGWQQATTGMEYTKTKHTVGRYPKLRPTRLLTLMQSGMTEAIYRHQGITNADTNVGYYPLGNRTDTTLGSRHLPIHIHDLTTFPNNTTNVSTAYSFYWSDSTSGANLNRFSLPNQNPDGSRDGNGYLDVESLSGGALVATPNAKKACHEWSDIRLLLYGARKRGTTFYIDFIRVKDEFANPISAASTDTSLKNLFRQWQSKLIYSSLQTFNGDMNKKIQFVKRFQYYIPGGSADDIDTIGKVKEVRIFLKQGNVYNLAWDTGNIADEIPHTQADGIDYTSSWTAANSPWHGSRLFMLIRAFAPEQLSNTSANWNASLDAMGNSGSGIVMTAADPLTEPSYDVIIRNKWLLP